MRDYDEALLNELENMDAPALPLTAGEMRRLRAAVGASTWAAPAESAVKQGRRIGKRRWRMALAAAAACLMLCIGAAAAWPQIQLTLEGNTIRIDAAAEQAGTDAAPLEPMTFGYLPKGYRVIWQDEAWEMLPEEQEQKTYTCEITNGRTGSEKTNAFIMKLSLDAGLQMIWGELDDGRISAEEWAQKAYNDALVLNTLSELTVEDLKQYSTLLWPEEDCYYVVNCVTLDRYELYNILMNME